VFTREDGRWWHPDHVTETIRELIADSGLPRIRPLQDLRHTHATLLLADGVISTRWELSVTGS
jgi:integrase